MQIPKQKKKKGGGHDARISKSGAAVCWKDMHQKIGFTLIYTSTWMNLKNFTLNRKVQTQKTAYCMSQEEAKFM